MLAMQNQRRVTKPILEINLRHPLVAAIAGADKDGGRRICRSCCWSRRRSSTANCRKIRRRLRAVSTSWCCAVREGDRTSRREPDFKSGRVSATTAANPEGSLIAMTTPDGTDIFYGAHPGVSRLCAA